MLVDFNPRSPHGERQIIPRDPVFAVQFQPTLPARGATQQRIAYFTAMLISPHAPRTGSDWERVGMGADRTISTHAPRTGSDTAF